MEFGTELKVGRGRHGNGPWKDATERNVCVGKSLLHVVIPSSTGDCGHDDEGGGKGNIAAI